MEKQSGNNGDIIFQEERLNKIQMLLERDNRLVTTELAKELNATSVTIRKDLLILEKRGLLRRTHGGAIKVNRLYHGLPLNEKEKINLEEKMRIVKKAVSLISEGDTIILDSGSTTSLLAKEIKHFKNLVVITNAINIVNELLDTDIEVIIVGGNLMKKAATTMGALADETLKRLSADKLFLSVDGIDLKIGLMTPNISEAQTSRVMMDISNEVVLLVDTSKFGRRSLGVISDVKRVDKLITTKKLSDEEQKRFGADRVEVLMV
ncbi:DeoR/GlpR family DNA-binding transcription regulator [Proteiniphilum sp. X52]|uniref:DeoR/GlpR family DNA-binding transcription regulator n=1 Tax=Proteiniphilum sp. X52 TaxID=2382159 RepID=UPI000F09B9EF|nr:DeoR/GlpR family DNA-binding transcription regulator [Proteiniphilum sp. X52]RNC63962.1 DeoR/GlpR transcriptional regulator [Proteiniphilum sp. X52]